MSAKVKFHGLANGVPDDLSRKDRRPDPQGEAGSTKMAVGGAAAEVVTEGGGLLATPEPAAPNRRARERRINGQSLREFRDSVPAYRKGETYTLATREFDMIKAAWMAQALDKETFSVEEVNTWAKCYALDQPKGKQSQSLLSLVREVDFLAHYDKIDLERPIFVGRMLFGKGTDKVENTFLLDGAHRLRKAFLEQKALPVVIFGLEETKALLMY